MPLSKEEIAALVASGASEEEIVAALLGEGLRENPNRRQSSPRSAAKPLYGPPTPEEFQFRLRENPNMRPKPQLPGKLDPLAVLNAPSAAAGAALGSAFDQPEGTSTSRIVEDQIRTFFRELPRAATQRLEEQTSPYQELTKRGVELNPLAGLVLDAVLDPLNVADAPVKAPAAIAAAAPLLGKGLGKGARGLAKQPSLFPVSELDELASVPRPQRMLAEVPAKSAPPFEAPRTYASPTFNVVKQLYELGKEGQDWYATTLPRIKELLGPDAEKMIDYLAATSPNASVKANTRFAIKALEQDRAGEPFSGMMGQTIDRLNKAKAGEEFGGLKVRDFARALKGDPNSVVVDRWIARLWGIDAPSAKQYGEIADQIRRHAAQLGVEPRQLQAALWAAAKKHMGRAGDTGDPFEEVLQEMVAQRSLFNPEGLSRKFPAGDKVEAPLFTGPQLQRYATDVVRLTKENKGATYNLRRGDLGGQPAYAVSVFPEREVVLPPGSELKPKDVAAFITENQDLLKDPRVSFGSWVVDAADASERYPAGSIVLGLSATFKDPAKARTLARQLGEEQIFDLQNFRTIPTGAVKREGALPDIAKRLEEFEDTDPEMLKLEHRSKVAGLTELDPAKYGTGENGLERKRSLNYPGKFLPRSFFTRKGGKVEHQINELPYAYDAEVPSGMLYDMGTDPEGLWAEAERSAKEMWGDGSTAGKLTRFEQLVKEKGYHGMWNSAADTPEMRDTVVLFTPTKVTQRAGDNMIQAGAEEYIRREGLSPEEFAARVKKINPKNAQRIAKAFEALPHDPKNPKVAAAYAALKKEVKKQFDFLRKELGIKMEPWRGEGQPYANSKEMMEDVAQNRRIKFFLGGDMPKDHPLAEIDPDTGLTYNDLFRAVHDVFGHAKEGFQFGPVGEENAFRTHARMFSPEARGALAMETKGQNSWVNFGPNRRLPAAKRPYAEQKANILPDELMKLAIIGAILNEQLPSDEQ